MSSDTIHRDVILGGNSLTIADICAIAASKVKIRIEATVIVIESVPPTILPASSEIQCSHDDQKAADLSDLIDHRLTRAIVALHVHQYMKLCIQSKNGISVVAREHIQFLVDTLNEDILPCLSLQSSSASMKIIEFAQGQGSALVSAASSQDCRISDIRAAIADNSKLQLPSEPLSSLEKTNFMQDNILLFATTVLGVGALKSLISIANAAATLSCEVLEASMRAFEAKRFESCGAYREVADVADHFRLLLEHSGYVKDENEAVEVEQGIACVPQVHGAIQHMLKDAIKTVESACSNGNVNPSHTLRMIMAMVTEAVEGLCESSFHRLQKMQPTSLVCNLEAPHGPQHPFAPIDRLIRLLEQELMSCVSYFKDKQAQTKICANKSASSAQVTAKLSAAQAKEDQKLDAMTPEQREKVLVKRRQKLEKQRKKEASKTAKVETLKLGLGTNQMYEYLCKEIQTKSCLSSVDPFAQDTDACFATYIDEVVYKLACGGARRKPKTAKGAQDFLPYQMQLREIIFQRIRSVFKSHGGQEIETPVFELKDTLVGKYGEDTKLIYDLADQGGELLALRYDLTVPFARFMAQHNPGNLKRYHIARVYRRDNPQMARGRFREFYQCDFDIAGSYSPMLPDAEIISIGVEVVQQFSSYIGSFKVKLSHRVLLDAILAICGVPSDKVRSICSAIDKLDKESWKTVREEMVTEKKLAPECADRIATFVCRAGEPSQLLKELNEDEYICKNKMAVQALAELKLLFSYLEAMGVLSHVAFDLSLARGLDYYTGLIYEFVLVSGEHQVGSIAAGGRYDHLVGMFSATSQQIPCVGISIGIERIFSIVQNAAHSKLDASKPQLKCKSPTQVLVASASGALMTEKLQICKTLWEAKIATEVMQLENPRFTKQLHYALENCIPFMIVIGEEEVRKGEVKLKIMASKEEASITRAEMVPELLRRKCATTHTISTDLA